MLVFPNAKINIGLNVLSRRPDGYHELSTLFIGVGLKDVLEINRSDIFEWKISGMDFPDQDDYRNNLIYRAWELMKSESDKVGEVKIHLHKIIPTGAGLGGGSADAAFALLLLNDLFEVGLSSEKLKELAAQLGSDCAFFIENRPAYGEGRGEVLSPFDLSQLQAYDCVLINPGIHVGTKEAYSGVVPSVPSQKLTDCLQNPIEKWGESVVNDFEKSVFKNHPVLQEIKDALYDRGAVYAAMSGSGSTMYGIFKKEQKVDTSAFSDFFCKRVDFVL